MIYERIKEVSKNKGITISELESLLGMSKGYLCKIDTHKPSVQKITNIAKTLGVSTEYLLTGEEKQFSTESADALAAIASDPELNALILKFMSLKLEDRAFVAKIIDTLS